MRFTCPSLLTLVLVVLASACDTPPVEWRDPTKLDAPVAATGATRLAIDETGAPRLEGDSVAGATTPRDSSRCTASLRTVRGKTRLYAVWWSVRPDSSAALDAAWSGDDGRTWNPTMSVDSTDRSSTGCNRPPPSVAALGDDLHVVYSMVAPEGTGVFFSHYMDGMFHSPVPVIYGERLARAAIAADSNRVAVAYEEPNGTRRQVDIALSQTQGHIFEWHGKASRDIDDASDPAIALRGSRIAVAWVTSDSIRTHVVREGRIH